MSATPVGAVQRVVPLTRLRSAVAKTVTASAAIPQFTVEYDVEVAAMAAVRPQLPPSVSYTDMVHAAAARALTRHRRLNASWADHGIVEHASINLGFALAMESQDGPAASRAGGGRGAAVADHRAAHGTGSGVHTGLGALLRVCSRVAYFVPACG